MVLMLWLFYNTTQPVSYFIDHKLAVELQFFSQSMCVLLQSLVHLSLGSWKMNKPINLEKANFIAEAELSQPLSQKSGVWQLSELDFLLKSLCLQVAFLFPTAGAPAASLETLHAIKLQLVSATALCLSQRLLLKCKVDFVVCWRTLNYLFGIFTVWE